jgi:hypothetical protein
MSCQPQCPQCASSPPVKYSMNPAGAAVDRYFRCWRVASVGATKRYVCNWGLSGSGLRVQATRLTHNGTSPPSVDAPQKFHLIIS